MRAPRTWYRACSEPAATSVDTRERREREGRMLKWLRGLSEGKQGLVVAGGLGLIVLGVALLIGLIT